MSVPLRGPTAAASASASTWLFLARPAREFVLGPGSSLGPVNHLRGTDRCLVEMPGTPTSVAPLACPHLGVHLTNAQIDETGVITCAGHGSRYCRTGVVIDGPSQTGIVCHDTITTDLGDWIWPSSEAPSPAPVVAELDGGTVVRSGSCLGPFDWRDVGENAVDSAHIHVLHGTPNVPQLTHVEFSEREASIGSTITWTTGQDRSREGDVEFRIFKPGLVVVRFGGIVPIVSVVACWSLNSSDAVLSWQVVIPDTANSANSTFGRGERRVAERLALEVERQLLQDIEIWRHRGPRVPPNYAPAETAIAQYRAWADS